MAGDWRTLRGRRPVAVEPEPGAPWRHWSRWPILAGLTVQLAGLPFEWGRVELDGQIRTYSATTGASDGITALVLTLILLIVASLRDVASTRTRTIQIVPAVLGALVLLVVFDGFRAVDLAIVSPIEAYRGHFEPGMWLALAGAFLTAAGGAAVSGMLVRNGRSTDLGASASVDVRAMAGEAITGGIGLVVGVAMGLWVLFSFKGNEAVTIALVPFLVLLSPFVVTHGWAFLRRRPPEE